MIDVDLPRHHDPLVVLLEYTFLARVVSQFKAIVVGCGTGTIGTAGIPVARGA